MPDLPEYTGRIVQLLRHTVLLYCYIERIYYIEKKKNSSKIFDIKSEVDFGVFTAEMAKLYLFRIKECGNMWYVIQTVTGKEKKLMLLIREILCDEHFETCFTIYAEWLKRLGGEWRLQVRPLFPGYVFIETGEPEKIFLDLKEVPGLTKLLGSEINEFVPVKEKEEQFLRMIIGNTVKMEEATVKLTDVKTERNGTISLMEGALSNFKTEIVKINLHKRYAIVKTQILGEERSLLFGIRLNRKKEGIPGRKIR